MGLLKPPIFKKISDIETSLVDKMKKYSLIFSQEKLITETNSQCLQRLIDALTTNGGTVVIDIDIEVNQKIAMKSNVVVTGDTRKRKIKIANGANITAIFEIGLINNSAIRRLTLDGNKSNNTSGSGIIFVENATNYYINTLDFSELLIQLFAEYGIYTSVGAGKAIGLQCHSLEICYCEKSGLYSLSSDSSIYDIQVYACGDTLGYHGVEIGYGNQKLSNIKIFKCGTSASQTYGLKLNTARSCILYNIDVQENNFGGLLLHQSYNNVISCIADSNNNQIIVDDTFGVNLYNSYNNKLTISFYNQTNAKPQKYDLYISRYSHDNDISYVSDNSDITKVKDYGYNNIFSKSLFNNKLPFTPNTSTTINGVTFSVDNEGYITMSGTASADATFYFYGDYNQTTIHFNIDAGKFVKIYFVDTVITNVSFRVLTDGTTVKYTISDMTNVDSSDAMNITGVSVKVLNGTTVNTKFKPIVAVRR